MGEGRVGTTVKMGREVCQGWGGCGCGPHPVLRWREGQGGATAQGDLWNPRSQKRDLGHPARPYLLTLIVSLFDLRVTVGLSGLARLT